MQNPKDRKYYKRSFYIRFKVTDVFNLKAAYIYAHSWFVDEEYTFDDGAFPEIYMLERNTQKNGKLILIRWVFQKAPFDITFYKRTIDVTIKIIGAKPVEIIQDNKKFKAEKAVFEVKVNAHLEVDAERKWRDHWFLKHILDIYVNRIYNTELDLNREELKRDVLAFQEVMKNYLNIMSFNAKAPNKKQTANKLESPYF